MNKELILYIRSLTSKEFEIDRRLEAEIKHSAIYQIVSYDQILKETENANHKEIVKSIRYNSFPPPGIIKNPLSALRSSLNIKGFFKYCLDGELSNREKIEIASQVSQLNAGKLIKAKNFNSHLARFCYAYNCVDGSEELRKKSYVPIKLRPGYKIPTREKDGRPIFF